MSDKLTGSLSGGVIYLRELGFENKCHYFMR